ncbi:hypothetical protein [Pseudomonas sp. S1(2024)]|uniref:DUF7281 domain-containing protein n=1 Tax=Pseudomonas sp. S1(2024) TaxID=3390191 RepID=UPI00397E3844
MNRKVILQALEALQREGLQPATAWQTRLATELKGLRDIGVVAIAVPPGKRTPQVIITDHGRLQARIDALKGEAIAENASVRATNLGVRGDTKSGSRLPYMLINVLGGAQTAWARPSGASLASAGDDPGAYQGIILRDDGIDDYEPSGDVVLIENRDVWLNIRPLLPKSLNAAALIQYEGWLSDRFAARLAHWRHARLFLLADYDPVGFQNHLRLQHVRPDAQMLIPDMSDDQLDQWGNRHVWQKSTRHLYTLNEWASACDSEAARFYNRIAKKGLAIEQEALLGIQSLSWRPLERVYHAKPAGNAQALSSHDGNQGGQLDPPPPPSASAARC